MNPNSVASLMSGLSAMDTKASGRLGVLTITYYLWTTFIAVIVGIILVLVIHPGTGTEKDGHRGGSGPVMTSADALLDLIRYICTQASIYPHTHACKHARTDTHTHTQMRTFAYTHGEVSWGAYLNSMANRHIACISSCCIRFQSFLSLVKIFSSHLFILNIPHGTRFQISTRLRQQILSALLIETFERIKYFIFASSCRGLCGLSHK